MPRACLARVALPAVLVLALAACGSAPPQTTPAPPAAEPPAPPARPAEPGGLAAQYGAVPLVVNAPPVVAATPPPVVPVAPAATPAATPTPVPAASAPRGPLIAFSSSRYTGSKGGYDVYTYDSASGTVYTVPGANSAKADIQPNVSLNGRYVVYSTLERGNFDIYLYDMATQLVDILPTLNTPGDELSPSVSDDGRHIAFVSGDNRLRLFDVASKTTLVPPPVEALGAPVDAPQLSADGQWVFFSSPNAVSPGDIYVYQWGGTSVLSPPFLSTPAIETDPYPSADGKRVLFASDRAGSFDLYEGDLVTGFVDRLVLANTAADERVPVYFGETDRSILYQSDRDGGMRFYAYHEDTGIVDTLPLAYEAYVAEAPVVAPPAGGGLFGRVGRGIGRGLGFGSIFQ